MSSLGGKKTLRDFITISYSERAGTACVHCVCVCVCVCLCVRACICEGDRLYLEVVHGGGGALAGAAVVPLAERVARAQQPGRLLLLEVADQGHGSVGAGQVVPAWRESHRAPGLEGAQRARFSERPEPLPCLATRGRLRPRLVGVLGEHRGAGSVLMASFPSLFFIFIIFSQKRLSRQKGLNKIPKVNFLRVYFFNSLMF